MSSVLFLSYSLTFNTASSNPVQINLSVIISTRNKEKYQDKSRMVVDLFLFSDVSWDLTIDFQNFNVLL